MPNVTVARHCTSLLALALCVLGGARAQAEAPKKHAPDKAGVLIAVTSATTSIDGRARQLAAGFVAKGFESFVAHEMSWPGPDADRRVIRGRWRLDDAGRLRRLGRLRDAAQAADHAMRLFAGAATEREHLELLVQALLERGTTAMQLQDPATAETVFLEALGIEPEHRMDPERFSPEARQLFADVRRAAHQLRFATLQLDAPGLPGAKVEVDFMGPRATPYTSKLPEGRHFVSVTAPGRHPVVVPISVRAERQHSVVLLAPPAGDRQARHDAVASFEPNSPATVVQVAGAAGLRFVLATQLSSSQVDLQLYDGRTGQALSSGKLTLSAQPSPGEINAGVDQLVQSILLADPEALEDDSEGSWYGTWWGVTIIGVVVAGAAAGTAVALTRGGETEYRFEP